MPVPRDVYLLAKRQRICGREKGRESEPVCVPACLLAPGGMMGDARCWPSVQVAGRPAVCLSVLARRLAGCLVSWAAVQGR